MASPYTRTLGARHLPLAVLPFGLLQLPSIATFNVSLIFSPQFTVVQWFNDYYPQGKTSIPSSFNIPGKIAWAVMETPGFVGLLFCMFTIPATQGIEKLPVANWLMAALFVGLATYIWYF